MVRSGDEMATGTKWGDEMIAKYLSKGDARTLAIVVLLVLAVCYPAALSRLAYVLSFWPFILASLMILPIGGLVIAAERYLEKHASDD